MRVLVFGVEFWRVLAELHARTHTPNPHCTPGPGEEVGLGCYGVIIYAARTLTSMAHDKIPAQALDPGLL